MHIKTILYNLIDIEKKLVDDNIKTYKRRLIFIINSDSSVSIDISELDTGDVCDYIYLTEKDNSVSISTNCYYMLYNILISLCYESTDLILSKVRGKCRMLDIKTDSYF